MEINVKKKHGDKDYYDISDVTQKIYSNTWQDEYPMIEYRCKQITK